jgi:hypothetical protein
MILEDPFLFFFSIFPLLGVGGLEKVGMGAKGTGTADEV